MRRNTAKVLQLEKDNVKALYRSAKACSEIEQLDLAEDTITHALKIEPANAALKELRTEILRRKGVVDAKLRIANAAAKQKFSEERLLKEVLKVCIDLTVPNAQERDITIKATPRPPDLGPIRPYHLSDDTDGHRDLMFPTILLYPRTSQTDIIVKFPISSTLNEQLSDVLEEAPRWDLWKEYTVDNVECFMEVEKATGKGLIKVGKAAPLEKALKGRTILDGIVWIFVVPKVKVMDWVTEWKQMNPQ